jgi:hypothetical protein
MFAEILIIQRAVVEMVDLFERCLECRWLKENKNFQPPSFFAHSLRVKQLRSTKKVLQHGLRASFPSGFVWEP